MGLQVKDRNLFRGKIFFQVQGNQGTGRYFINDLIAHTGSFSGIVTKLQPIWLPGKNPCKLRKSGWWPDFPQSIYPEFLRSEEFNLVIFNGSAFFYVFY